jgi:membrane-associated phospholipid phosphatase
VLLTSTVVLTLAVDPRTHGGHGGVLYDSAIRNLLRAHTRAGRDRTRIVGDLGYRTLLLYPLLDVLITPLAVHGNGEVAWQMFAMDLEALSVAGFVGVITDHFIGRARPSYEPCQRDGHYEAFCHEKDEFSSLVSGHSAIAAAGAGLTCAHHLNLPLYGGGVFDVGSCVAASALALTTGLARIANDRHWASDVTVGLLVGGLAGYGLPALLHHRSRSEPSGSAGTDLRWIALPVIAPGELSGHVHGLF